MDWPAALIILLCPLLTGGRTPLSDDLRMFLVDNGLKYASVVSGDMTGFGHRLASNLTEGGRLYIREAPLAAYTKLYRFNFDSQVFVWSDRDLTSILKAISTTTVKSSVLVSPSWNSQREAELQAALWRLKAGSLFFLLKEEGGAWHQVITLTSGYSMNKLRFGASGAGVGRRHIAESYDLGGLAVKNIALPWMPYFDLTDCNSANTNCETSGYLDDYMGMIRSIANFTVVSTLEPDGDWGTLPKSGPYNLSGTWGGVLGSVVNKEYDITLSPWAFFAERHAILDMVPVLPNKMVLAWTPKNPERDFGLFVRPFTRSSWITIMLTLAVSFACILATYYLIPGGDGSNGQMIMVTTVWYFFVLINAYYGGALTMFFTSTITVPFSSIKDVLAEHPNWKMLYQRGNEAYFALPAEVDPDYRRYWDSVQLDEPAYAFASLEEGLQRIRSDEAVMFSGYGVLKAFFQENPHFHQRIDVFATVSNEYGHILLSHNSPLRPVIRHTALWIQDRGIQNYLMVRYTGKDLNENWPVDKMVLTPGQTILILVVMAGALVLCAALFCGELIVYHSKRQYIKARPQSSFPDVS